MGHGKPDLFPGFDTITVETASGWIHCRTGGSGPPLLLLHGYPQSHVIWHKIAPSLAEHFRLVMPDLPGYGASDVPPISPDHGAYSKRTMAATMVELMRILSYDRFAVAGHDRGGRVAYRMALDHPEIVERLAVLDILPTYDYWNRMNRVFGLNIYHWMFLAQPAPFPEDLIAASPIRFLEHTLASWTAQKSLDCFAPEALAHTRAWFCDPDRISATCEDYRAGATIDYKHDEDDMNARRKIKPPVMVLWGTKGIAARVRDPLKVWKGWCDQAGGHAIDCGHFVPEEAPLETGKYFTIFFKTS
ncbi:alpha/beta hydrolase [Roseibium denhamense]|uniref:Haloacetate dehalogenase n=1 Tax=Roseibium denhamense TaxID=76305 RepID=A0ABY1P2C2_9HYPH|nr:alpha/beta hydrolase [Roseibium denhamense]MTI07702.1 alpha/beta hydrolase [Roseibium denhamense]SMP24742.1 haloacetate dehalogenase [Roseibium denhamense]